MSRNIDHLSLKATMSEQRYRIATSKRSNLHQDTKICNFIPKKSSCPMHPPYSAPFSSVCPINSHSVMVTKVIKQYTPTCKIPFTGNILIKEIIRKWFAILLYMILAVDSCMFYLNAVPLHLGKTKYFH